MEHHAHGIKGITKRTINGKGISKALIVEENGVFQAIITDLYGHEFASGSNSRDLESERAVLRKMLDPI